jgi:hypothetical protein
MVKRYTFNPVIIDEIIKLKESRVDNMVKENICKKCRAILIERDGKFITTQAFCICCGRGHGGPLCGCCREARNVYREVFEELDRVLRSIVNSGLDHEFTKDETINLNAAQDLATSLWSKGNILHHKLKSEGKVD